jgi:ribosomal protein L7/L12
VREGGVTVEWVLVTLGVVVLLEMFALQQHVTRLERRMYAIWRMARELKQAHDANPFDDELRELVAMGNKILAIRRARERLGLSLREAKDYVYSL